jgi:hypothetical protein
VAIVTVWAVVAFTGLLLSFGYPLANGLTHLAHRLPSYVQSAAHGRGWIGHLARRFHLTAWVARNAPKLQSLGAGLARSALSVGKGAASLLATLATITALLLLLLLEGPKMRRGLLGLSSSRHQSWNRADPMRYARSSAAMGTPRCASRRAYSSAAAEACTFSRSMSCCSTCNMVATFSATLASSSDRTRLSLHSCGIPRTIRA